MLPAGHDPGSAISLRGLTHVYADSMTRSRAARLAGIVLGTLLAVSGRPAAALSIAWNYDYDSSGFFAPGSAARTTLNAAGAWYEANLTDALLPISPLAGSPMALRFRNPGTLNAAGDDQAFATIVDPTIAADTVMIMVGAVDLDYRSPGTLAIAQPGSTLFQIDAPQAYVDQVIARGQGASGIESDVRNAVDPGTLAEIPTAHDFALWGGMLSVDADRAWHTDYQVSPTGGLPDLFSVLLHELGHVFGIGTADYWHNQVSGGSFTGSLTEALFGAPVPLDAEAAHWANSGIGTSPAAAGFEAAGVSAGTPQETALDPVIALGQRKVLTELDLAGLADVGWELAQPVPLPAGLPLLLQGLAGILLVGVAGHRRAPRRV